MQLTINLPDHYVTEAFDEAASKFGLQAGSIYTQEFLDKLNKGEDTDDIERFTPEFKAAVAEDIETDLVERLEDWFRDGINNDVYHKFVETCD